MKRNKRLALIGGAAVLLAGAPVVVICLGGWSSPRLSAAAADLPAVERASLDACLCRRKGGAEAACNTIYTDARDAMLKRVYGDHVQAFDEMASACAPIATTVSCFDFADGTRCITTKYNVVAGTRDAVLTEVCTADEARAVEQVVERAWRGPDGKDPESGDQAAWDAANRRTNAAVDDLLRRIKAGEQVKVSPESNGCAG